MYMLIGWWCLTTGGAKVVVYIRQNIGFNIVGCRQLWLVPL